MTLLERVDDRELFALPHGAICRVEARRGQELQTASAFLIGAGRLLTAASAIAFADALELYDPRGGAQSLPAGAASHDPESRTGDLAVIHADVAALCLPLAELDFSPASGLIVAGHPASDAPDGIDPRRQLRARALPGSLGAGGSFQWLEVPAPLAPGAALCAEVGGVLAAVGVHLGARGAVLFDAQAMRWARRA